MNKISPQFQVRSAHWAADAESLTAIRTEVFMQEQAVSSADEWDGLDESAIHFLLENDQQAIGCARLIKEAQGEQLQFHIGRVALRKMYRAQGLGHFLMQEIIAYCRALDRNANIYLHAQSSCQGFYTPLGFSAQGEEFIDAGIAHISMWLYSDQHSNS
jgi:predicted GNAT family N-acyltransferase